MSKVINNIPFIIDIGQLKKDLMISNQADGQVLLQMITELKQIANPRAIYKEVYINKKGEDFIVIEGLKLKSRILRKNLTETNRCFIYLVTVGQEIEAWGGRKRTILESYWADEIQKVLLNSAISYVYQKLDRLIGSEDTAEMNPGSLINWPIEEQLKLFTLLGDVKSKIAVRLTDSFLILPAKSISGIKFPTKLGFNNCKLCQRDNCPTRMAAYDQKLLKEMMYSY